MHIGGDMGAAKFLAIDWGTTNFRAFALGFRGAVLATERSDRGMLAISDGGFVQELGKVRASLGDLPAICAGMVGSAKGWVNVPYVGCPAGLDELAGNIAWAEPGRTAIVPGVSCPRGDVMRGEEVQFLGAVASGMAPDNALLCQPGTHCKWARVTAGKITHFSTGMTGELFALLKNHSLLADFMQGPVADGGSFRAGVREGLAGGLLNRLFSVRASALLGLREIEDSAAFASGLLIGSDVASQCQTTTEPVYIFADPHLGELYGAAIEEAGGRAILLDSHAAFVAGIKRIWEHIHDQFVRTH